MYNTNNNNKGIFTNSSNQQSTNGNNVFNSSCLAASNENFTTNSSRIGPGQMNIFSNGVNSNQKSQNTINLLGNQMGNSNQIQGKFSLGTNSGVQNGGSGGVNNLVGCSNGISNGTNLFGGNNNIFQNQNENPNTMFQSSTKTSNLFPQPQTNIGPMTPAKQGTNTNQSNTNNLLNSKNNSNNLGIFQNNQTNNNNPLNLGVFGNNNSLIKQQQSNMPLQANGNIFHAPNMMSHQNTHQGNFNQNKKGTFNIKYQPQSFKEKENETIYIMSIGFELNKSHEELRYEDLILKKSGAKLQQINNNLNNNISGGNNMSGNSLFVGTNNTSIFGNSNTNNLGGTSQLFNKTNETTSLFGNPATSNTNNQSNGSNPSSFFGNPQPSQGTSNQNSLFGPSKINSNQPQQNGVNSNNSNPQISGIFNPANSNQSAQNNSGLGSNQNNFLQERGLFTNNTTNNQNTLAQPQTSIFSNQNQNTTNTNQNSLFSLLSNNPGQSQPTLTPSLFSNLTTNSNNQSSINQVQHQPNNLLSQPVKPNSQNLFIQNANVSSNPGQQTTLFNSPAGGSNSLFNIGQNQSDGNKTPSFQSTITFGPSPNNSSLFQQTNINDPNKSNTNTNASQLFSSMPVTNSNTVGTQQTSLFQNPSNPTTSTSQQPQQQIAFIPAPSNILGIDLNSVSPLVKSAVLGDKSMKDFISEVEAEFFEDDYQGYYSTAKRKPSALSKLNNIDDYYRKYDHSSYFQRDSKSKYSFTPNYDSGIYANLPMYSHSKSTAQYSYPTETSFMSKYRTSDNFPESYEYSHSFLQTKRHQEREKDFTRDYDFNKNIIEINQKINYSKYSKSGSYEKYQESHKKRKLEDSSEEKSFYFGDQNIDENIISNNSNRKKTSRPEIDIDPKLLDLIPSEKKYKKISNIIGTPSDEKIIDVKIIIKKYKGHDLPINLKINKNNKVRLLKEFYADKLITDYSQLFQRIKADNIILIKANSIMKDTKMIHEYSIKNDDVLFATISIKHQEHENEFGRLENNIASSPLKLKRIRGGSISPIDSLPKLTKPGYHTNPDFVIISRMTVDQLKKVENFQISNENGSIQWTEKVDLTRLNLDDIVEINNSMISLYKGHLNKLPPCGQGLNKPFRITMKVLPQNEDDLDEFEGFLKGYVKNLGGVYEKYDRTYNILVFSCKEISKG